MQIDHWHFPRPKLAKAYLDYFELGLSSARGLFARRRMGKTEFLKQDFIPAAEDAGYLTAYVNFWEDRRQPATALVEALFFAVEPHGLEQFLKKLKRPIKKLKASGKVLGVGEGTLEAEMADVEKAFSGTGLIDVMRQ